jgi:hypothetical protein
MALVTTDLFMFSEQSEVRMLAVVELRFLPGRFFVAVLAFFAILALMCIVIFVAVVTLFGQF